MARPARDGEKPEPKAQVQWSWRIVDGMYYYRPEINLTSHGARPTMTPASARPRPRPLRTKKTVRANRLRPIARAKGPSFATRGATTSLPGSPAPPTPASPASTVVQSVSADQTTCAKGLPPSPGSRAGDFALIDGEDDGSEGVDNIAGAPPPSVPTALSPDQVKANAGGEMRGAAVLVAILLERIKLGAPGAPSRALQAIYEPAGRPYGPFALRGLLPGTDVFYQLAGPAESPDILRLTFIVQRGRSLGRGPKDLVFRVLQENPFAARQSKGHAAHTVMADAPGLRMFRRTTGGHHSCSVAFDAGLSEEFQVEAGAPPRCGAALLEYFERGENTNAACHLSVIAFGSKDDSHAPTAPDMIVQASVPYRHPGFLKLYMGDEGVEVLEGSLGPKHVLLYELFGRLFRREI